MNRYYLFGAGINAYAVIQFFGKQMFIAAIDSDEKKHGTEIEGIPIISLREYVKRKDKATIIITGYYYGKSIAEELDKQGISNYYICPYMQNGYYEDIQDIVEKLELYRYSKIAFCTINPISECLELELRRRNGEMVIQYFDRDQMQISSNVPVIITNGADKLLLQRNNRMNESNLVLDINEIYEKKFGYKNEKIKSIKNIHQNKRCFVIGNGPSLTYEDLEQLHNHNEICFGVNRIYLAYPYTNWRPDYYVAVDHVVIRNDSVKLLKLEGIKFIRHSYKFVEEWSDNGIYEFRGLAYPPEHPQLSFDMYQGIYMGHSVVYDTIQIALYMGFREIYLLGVDMTSKIEAEKEGAHFYRTPNQKEILGISNTKLTRKCLEYAAIEIEKSGRKLRNATRGGELKEVKRVDFDLLF